MADLVRAKALRRWAKTDPVLHAIAKATRSPYRALGLGTPFEALCTSICHQQVSLAAGQAIYARLAAACAGKVTPENVGALGSDGLLKAGLSRSKAKYLADLAQKAITREVDLDALAAMGDDEVIDALTKVKGIGVWTAKMFLLFHLQRPDVLPHEDLGLEIAVSKAYGVPRERAAAKMERMRPRWSPYCSYASLVLWGWRRQVA